ncbi:35635_t:CDS:2, partial [Gigaspora margarita]
NPYQPGTVEIFPEEISAKIESTKMDVDLERLSKEIGQLNKQFDDAFNTCINATSRPRPTYTTPRPIYYDCKEGYAIGTSTRHPRHYCPPNQRRNLPVRPNWKKGNDREAYCTKNTEAFKAEIGHANETCNYEPCYDKIEKNEVEEPD